jgi:hypothetical protein
VWLVFVAEVLPDDESIREVTIIARVDMIARVEQFISSRLPDQYRCHEGSTNELGIPLLGWDMCG